MMRALKLLSASLIATAVALTTQAQQPTPPMVVVQAVGSTATATPAAAPASTSPDAAISGAIKALEQMKAANDALLKKQEAMLQQLDELQKAAEQLKVFSKRV